MATQAGVWSKAKALVAAYRGRTGGEKPGLDPIAYFMRGERSPFLFGWRPALRDTQDAIRESYVIAAARATEAIYNSGWISGGVDQAISAIMGPGMRLNARPDTTVVKFSGVTDDDGKAIDADGWARFVERRWEAWSTSPRECDAVGRQTVNQILRSALKQWFRTGEILGVLPHRDEPTVSMTATKVLLMQSHRLSQRTDATTHLVQGVRMDEAGRPNGYLFEFRPPGVYSIDYKEVSARDGAGRPQVVHVFEGGPGEVRGISPLIPAIAVTRQFDQLANATLTAALIQTIFAATVESEMPSADFLQSLKNGAEQQGLAGGDLDTFLAAATGWSQQTTFDLGQINHLFPGEKMKFNRSEHPNGTYEPFAKFLLREIARCLGLTYEQFTGDYTGATYSSVRMSTAEQYQITLHRRKNIAGPFMQAVYEAWLEEEIDTGRIKFPGGIDNFLTHRSAACRADWRGPPKPQADDIKTANMHRIYKQLGLMSDEMIAADLGVDIEDVYEALERERKLREKFGIFVVPAPAVNGIPGAPPDDPEDEDPEDEDTPIVPVPVKPVPGK